MINESFDLGNSVEYLKDTNLDIVIVKSFLTRAQSDWLLSYCINNITWGQDIYTFGGGRQVLSPRLTALYGEKPYGYSGQSSALSPFTKVLERLKTIISLESKADYNVVLLNQYRNGNDSVSWHTDAEKSLGNNPVIGSLSLGVSRTFKIREIANKSNGHDIVLAHGDLIIMQGKTQHYWEHSVPKSKKINDVRVNLTFRKII